MKRASILLVVFVIGLPSLRFCYAADAATCITEDRQITACNQKIILAKTFDMTKRNAAEEIVAELTNMIVAKNVKSLIDHENNLIKTDDNQHFDDDEYSFLFGEKLDKPVSRKSVRQVITESKLLTVYIEPHNLWESYKGELYILIYFDASKISIDKVFKDLAGRRQKYMNSYAACLVQATDKGWLLPETAFFWGTDGP